MLLQACFILIAAQEDLGISNHSAVLVVVVNAQNKDSIFIRRATDEILLDGKVYNDLRVLTKQILMVDAKFKK